MDYSKGYYHAPYFEGTSSSNFSRRLLLNSSNTGLALSNYSPQTRSSEFMGHHSTIASSRYSNHSENIRFNSRTGIAFNPTSNSSTLQRRKDFGTIHNLTATSSPALIRRHYRINTDPKQRLREIETNSKISNESGFSSLNKINEHDFALTPKLSSSNFGNTISVPYSSATFLRPQRTNFNEYLRTPVTTSLPPISDYTLRAQAEREVNTRSKNDLFDREIPNIIFSNDRRKLSSGPLEESEIHLKNDNESGMKEEVVSKVSTTNEVQHYSKPLSFSSNSKSTIQHEYHPTSKQDKIDISLSNDICSKSPSSDLDIKEVVDQSQLVKIIPENPNMSLTLTSKDNKIIQKSFLDNKSSTNNSNSDKSQIYGYSSENEILKNNKTTVLEEANFTVDTALKLNKDETAISSKVNAEPVPENPHRRQRYRRRNTALSCLETNDVQNVTSRCRTRVRTDPDNFSVENSVEKPVTTSRDRIRKKSVKYKIDKSSLELLNNSCENAVQISLELKENRNEKINENVLKTEENFQKSDKTLKINDKISKSSDTVIKNLIDSTNQIVSPVFVEESTVNNSVKPKIPNSNKNNAQEGYESNIDTTCDSNVSKSNVTNECEPIKPFQKAEKLNSENKTVHQSASSINTNETKSKPLKKPTNSFQVVDTKTTLNKFTDSSISPSKYLVDSKPAINPIVVDPFLSENKSESSNKTTNVPDIVTNKRKTNISAMKPILKLEKEKVITSAIENLKEGKDDNEIFIFSPSKKLPNTTNDPITIDANEAIPIDKNIVTSFSKGIRAVRVPQEDINPLHLIESQGTASNDNLPLQNGKLKGVLPDSKCPNFEEQSKNAKDNHCQSNNAFVYEVINSQDKNKTKSISSANQATLHEPETLGKSQNKISYIDTKNKKQTPANNNCDGVTLSTKYDLSDTNLKIESSKDKLIVQADNNRTVLKTKSSLTADNLSDSKHSDISSTVIVKERTSGQGIGLVKPQKNNSTIKIGVDKTVDGVETPLSNLKPLKATHSTDNAKKPFEAKSIEKASSKPTLKDSTKPNKNVTNSLKADTTMRDTSGTLDMCTNKENIPLYSGIIPSTIPEQKPDKESDKLELETKEINKNNENKQQEISNQKVRVSNSSEFSNIENTLDNKSLNRTGNIHSTNKETSKLKNQSKVKITEKKALKNNKFLIHKEASTDMAITSPKKHESKFKDPKLDIKINEVTLNIKQDIICNKVLSDTCKSNKDSVTSISTKNTEDTSLSDNRKSDKSSVSHVSKEDTDDKGSSNYDVKGSAIPKEIISKDDTFEFRNEEISANSLLTLVKQSTCETTDINPAQSNRSLNTQVIDHSTENGTSNVHLTTKKTQNSFKYEPGTVNEESIVLTNEKALEPSETCSFVNIEPANAVNDSENLDANISTKSSDDNQKVSKSEETKQMVQPPTDEFTSSVDDPCTQVQQPLGGRKSSEESGGSDASSMSTEEDTESEDESFKRECEEFDNINKLDNVSYQKSTSTKQATDSKRLRFRKYDIDDFVFLKVLGEGAFGKVVLAELKDHNMYFAVKSLKKCVVLKDEDADGVIVEKKILSLGTQHPFICKLFFTFQTESSLFFVMEYLVGGDLLFHIQKRPFSKNRARFYGAEIISGLRFLHKRGVIYRDLKLDNVMLDIDGHVRLVDFGLCECGVYSEEAWHFVGTPAYMAPEILERKKYNQSVDWWSFGVLMYEMVFGRLPFKGTDEDELFWSICHEEPSYSEFMAFDVKDVLKKLLKKTPTDRLGMPNCPTGSIEEHSFFRDIDWDRLVKKEIRPPFKPHVAFPSDTHNFSNYSSDNSLSFNPTNSEILELKTMNQDAFKGFSYTNPYVIG